MRPSWGTRLAFPLVLAALLAFGACEDSRPGASGRPSRQAGTGTVTKVVDGDTLHVRLAASEHSEEKVRLIGIDTPETHGPGGLRECFGSEATSRAQALLPVGTRVRLVRDVEPRDRYGRLLAYVYRAQDGLFVNLALAREGFATTLTYPPNVAHSHDLSAAVGDARHAQRGLWRSCGGADTPLR